MKNKMSTVFLIFGAILLINLGAFYGVLFTFSEVSTHHKIVIVLMVFIFAALLFFIILFSYINLRRKREVIKKSFDYYMEEEISKTGTGIIVFNHWYEIIWCSTFIIERLGKKVIGSSLEMLSEKFVRSLREGENNFRFPYEGFVFEANVNLESRVIIIRDITNEAGILKQYTAERLVVGELEIDNFQQHQVTLPEDELFSIQAAVLKLLDDLSAKWNFIYKQYVNGKYVLFTNQKSLNEMEENGFMFLDAVRKVSTQSGNLSISIGFGSGTTIQKELQQLAREGLNQAQSRGGDQIALIEYNKKPKYYGSKFEVIQAFSRVKIRQISSRFESALLSDKTNKIMIYGHKLADLDAVGAAIGVLNAAKHFNKKAYIVNQTFDSTTKKYLADNFGRDELEKIFISPKAATKSTNSKTLVVIVDTADLSRIENPFALEKVRVNDNVFIFDHHRIFKMPEGINPQNIYIDSTASSASEIIAEVIRFAVSDIKLESSTAQALLNGIFLDTSNFTKSTTTKTYQAASYLEILGAKSSIASNILKIPEEASKFIKDIGNNVQEIKPGYFLATLDEEVPDDVISMAAEDILKTQGRIASFVIAKSSTVKKAYKMSARSVDTNIQRITEGVGGGGHFASAAALSNEPLEIFTDNVRQAIISDRGDK